MAEKILTNNKGEKIEVKFLEGEVFSLHEWDIDLIIRDATTERETILVFGTPEHGGPDFYSISFKLL